MPNAPTPSAGHLDRTEILQLQRWDTPTVYNGWERITRQDPTQDGFNLEAVHDYMPDMGPMCGYAVTVVIEPSDPAPRKSHPDGWSDYRAYVAQTAGPKIVVVQDMDKPRVAGAFWGEVNSNIHRALGCVGTIVDGAIRDLEGMTKAGFKALARQLCVGHAAVHPLRWGCSVEVFGRIVQPGQLIHADRHGFLAIPCEDEAALLEAVRTMDANECQTLIAAATNIAGKTPDQILAGFNTAAGLFDQMANRRFPPPDHHGRSES
ncbi:MAG TPA: RraA family protein [Candidatus Paceibacterota bacterium]|nr:RraA family protein [Verrucomicrobiota bacterium]HRZ45018.1 RraA family protein [Candidatus Paceibacterota bacterium]HRZ92682.1 RraA family protein [Candidatus Paceibacterota bacterium]